MYDQIRKTTLHKVLEDIFEDVRWAPSAHNYQPWKFYVIEDAELRKKVISNLFKGLEELRKKKVKNLVHKGIISQYATDERLARLRKSFETASVIVLLYLNEEIPPQQRDPFLEVLPKVRRLLNEQSVAIIGLQFLLAVHLRKLGACWWALPLFIPNRRKRQLKRIVHARVNEELRAIFTLGLPAEDPLPPPRKEARDIVTFQ